MSFALAMKTNQVAVVRSFTITLTTAVALLLMSACGNTNPNVVPGTDKNQPLSWNTTDWDTSDWT